MMARVAVLALVLLGPLASPAAAGSLTGDVFVTMKSGDVRRAADVDVIIIKATPEFEAEWERLQTEYEERVSPVVAEYRVLKARQEELERDQQAARQSQDFAASGRLGDQVLELLKQIGRFSQDRWLPLQQEYTAAAVKVVSRRATAKVPTDVNGHFEVSVPAGRYYVYCRYALSRETLYWLVPVQVPDVGRAKISLSNRAATRSPLRGQIYASF